MARRQSIAAASVNNGSVSNRSIIGGVIGIISAYAAGGVASGSGDRKTAWRGAGVTGGIVSIMRQRRRAGEMNQAIAKLSAAANIGNARRAYRRKAKASANMAAASAARAAIIGRIAAAAAGVKRHAWRQRTRRAKNRVASGGGGKRRTSRHRANHQTAAALNNAATYGTAVKSGSGIWRKYRETAAAT